SAWISRSMPSICARTASRSGRAALAALAALPPRVADGVVVADPAGRFAGFFAAVLLAVLRGELIDAPSRENDHPDPATGNPRQRPWPQRPWRPSPAPLPEILHEPHQRPHALHRHRVVDRSPDP